VHFNFSKSQEVSRPVGGVVGGGGIPTPILLLTIYNANYPITVDVLHTITSTYGQIRRIVIFKKAQVQALVEFDSVQSALTAKQALDGADIYAGCCTLRIEFSRTPALNVRRQCSESWDYTLAHDVSAGLQAPPAGYAMMGMGSGSGVIGGGGGVSGAAGGYNGASGSGSVGGVRSDHHAHTHHPHHHQMGVVAGAVTGVGGAVGPAVVMVYNLPKVMNCQRLFNLLCIYGNVTKIKFLQKEGTAMAELTDVNAARSTIEQLSGLSLMSASLVIQMSRHPTLGGHPNPSQVLPDGTPVMVDFTSTLLNRFMTQKSASRTRVIRPTRLLHFYHGPSTLSETELRDHFTSHCNPSPSNILNVKIFDKSTPTSNTSGLIEFSTIEDAVNALVLVNHLHITSAGIDGGMLKLAFSPATSITASRTAADSPKAE
jgi:heterogeneous nuclear ribonucleoprotein L